jgi:hypothetical protein
MMITLKLGSTHNPYNVSARRSSALEDGETRPERTRRARGHTPAIDR